MSLSPLAAALRSAAHRSVALRAAALAVVVVAATPAASQPPDRIDHYKLVPGRSVLLQTGGFAGVSHRYPLLGEHDFVQQWEGGTPFVPYARTARFEAADWYAPLGELLPAQIDVDQLLGLTGLRGELLPVASPYDVYHFRGLAGDSDAASPLESSTVDLYARLLGSWMFLWGKTTPPPSSADAFAYEVRAVALSGAWLDANGDGAVDAADYTLVRDAAGGAPQAAFSEGSLADWAAQYGEVAPDADAVFASLQAAAGAAAAMLATEPGALSVPEPGALALLALAAAAAPSVGRARRR